MPAPSINILTILADLIFYMSLRLKFNLVLLIVFSLGCTSAGLFSYNFLHAHAREEVVQTAGSMMAAAMAIRLYTIEQIRPQFEKFNHKMFPPQTVPAFAATEVFEHLRKNYRDYLYKEATLNPTNPRDRASDWEADIIYKFRNFPESTELIGERITPVGQMLYLARPIKIPNQSCLECHSTPQAAPKLMTDTYGKEGGFGWKLNETVGAQVVSVPMALAVKKADSAFRAYMSSLVVVLAIVFIVLNIMLDKIVVKPLIRLSKAVDKMSSGKMDLPELEVVSSDEIGLLARSFNRMRRSLDKAISMIGE